MSMPGLQLSRDLTRPLRQDMCVCISSALQSACRKSYCALLAGLASLAFSKAGGMARAAVESLFR